MRLARFWNCSASASFASARSFSFSSAWRRSRFSACRQPRVLLARRLVALERLLELGNAPHALFQRRDQGLLGVQLFLQLGDLGYSPVLFRSQIVKPLFRAAMPEPHAERAKRRAGTR